MPFTRKPRQTIGCNIRAGMTPGGFCHRGMESQVTMRKKRACETVKEHANAFLEKRGIIHSHPFQPDGQFAKPQAAPEAPTP